MPFACKAIEGLLNADGVLHETGAHTEEAPHASVPAHRRTKHPRADMCAPCPKTTQPRERLHPEGVGGQRVCLGPAQHVGDKCRFTPNIVETQHDGRPFSLLPWF